MYARRSNKGFFLAHNGSRPVFRVSADCSPWVPKHSLARRLVTTHNDLHLDNIVFSSSARRFFLVDIDQIGVGPAINDLAHIISKLDNHMPHFKRAFLEGYLEAMAKAKSQLVEGASESVRVRLSKNSSWGESGDSSQWGLDTLMIDCELAKLGTWYSPIMYPVLSPALRSGLLKIYNLADDDVVWRIVFAQKFAAMVRGSPQMQDHMRAKGLRGTLGSLSHGRYRTEGANLMHELRQLSLQSGKGPLYFANVSCALSELVRGPRSTPAQFRPSTPLDGTGDQGAHRHTNARIKNDSSHPLANLEEESEVESRDLSSWEDEDEDMGDEGERFIQKGEVLQRIVPGLLAAWFHEDGSP